MKKTHLFTGLCLNNGTLNRDFSDEQRPVLNTITFRKVSMKTKDNDFLKFAQERAAFLLTLQDKDGGLTMGPSDNGGLSF